MNKYWISWYHNTEKQDIFELHFPWWVSGDTDNNCIICAAVIADTEENAIDYIQRCYCIPNRLIDIRFCNLKDANWSPFNDRFQKEDWMKWQG